VLKNPQDELQNPQEVLENPPGSSFLAPGGRVLGSRAQAIKLLTTMPGTEGQVEAMRAGLAKDGWAEETHLPARWLAKRREDGLTVYLTPNYEKLKSVKNALSYMRLKNYDDETMARFSRKRPAEEGPEAGPPRKSPRAEVAVKQEPTEEQWPLPAGWRTEGEGLLSPQGRAFPTRVAAAEWMIQSKVASEQIYQMWSGLEAEGWQLGTARTELLPAGWRLQWGPGVADWLYLTRESRVRRGTRRARAPLAASREEFDTGALARFDEWAAEVAAAAAPLAWSSEPSLPAGWRLALGPEGGLEVLEDPQGARFEGRKEAIDQLIREHYSPSDIFRLWSTLHREGWQGDEAALPTGWQRKWFAGEGRYHYLSPMMEVVRGTAALVAVVGRGEEYTQGERERVAVWAAQQGDN
jgi:hypothetical protein